MSGLMGDWRCRPVMERGIYAVYVKGDIDALRERNARLRRAWAEVVHQNALLEQERFRREMGHEHD